MSIFYFENTPHGTRRDGSKLNTKLHFKYIAREGKFEKSRSRREDLVFLASGNLPEWAENASDFWEQAETHRRKNGRAYREFRLGLQEELTLEENKALIERFIEETGIKKNHVYSYAIHDKPAAFDSRHRNIHCHLMFSEKVLEADRSLSEDKFFKNYAENEAGEPTQGYRTETYWARKEATLELREKWAQLVNDKFKEKGLSCRIDHRTLNAQRHDLIEQGKLEEAVLLDRTPAPHLGNIYKNPAMMKKIQFAIEEAYRTADDSEVPADATDERSLEEVNIAVFANDFALRKIAREIQQERLRIRAERENAQDDHEIAEIQDDPYTVTVEDVYSYCAKKESVYRKLAARELAQYKRMKKSTDKKIQYVSAVDRVFGGEYGKTKKAYAATAKKLQTARAHADALVQKKEKSPALFDALREVKRLSDERTTLGKKLAALKTEMKTDAFREKVDAIVQQNQSTQPTDAAIAAAYKKHVAARKEAERYAAIRSRLEKADRAMILFADKMPRTLNRYSKIDGETPIGSLRSNTFDGKTYAFLGQLPDDGNKITTIEAVRMNDDIRRGSVPKYQLLFDREKGRIISAAEARDTDGNVEHVRLYRTKNRRDIQRTTNGKRGARSPRVRQAISRRVRMIRGKISALTDRFLREHEQQGKITVHWQEDQTRDKAIAQEEKMYQNWGR
ncbi:hypothetical protein AXF19_05080 [Selenomonas sp. oral taxon 126]|uniref:MobA/MobL family protein n=1 Tax=Selenomonas sp. oral taxon 126 TaxID=712528 RepID=UPI0008078AB1|nr:MobA/MobL family protein [Selenomonas sp. oral taxon 126]ANR70410.1 hypothetical protein AXF19_05080 [Selenomonas sp. oral taxon 126]